MFGTSLADTRTHTNTHTRSARSLRLSVELRIVRARLARTRGCRQFSLRLFLGVRSSGNFIEIRDKEHPGSVDHSLVYKSFMADINLLRHADMVVGTAGSIVSRLFLLVVTGDRGRVPPYVMLDKPFEGPF